MEVLRRMFRGQITSRFGDESWSLGSPDLSVCDFFLGSGGGGGSRGQQPQITKFKRVECNLSSESPTIILILHYALQFSQVSEKLSHTRMEPPSFWIVSVIHSASIISSFEAHALQCWPTASFTSSVHSTFPHYRIVQSFWDVFVDVYFL